MGAHKLLQLHIMLELYGPPTVTSRTERSEVAVLNRGGSSVSDEYSKGDDVGIEPDESSDQTNVMRAVVTDTLANQRLDRVCAQLFAQYSRGQIQKWIQQGMLTLNNVSVAAKHKVRSGDEITLSVVLTSQNEAVAQPIPLDIVFEDDHVLVLNKSRGFVVHPGAGVPDGTVLNAVLHHAPECSALPRGGIVHRLDKDTTGLMVVAKTLEAHHSLVSQLQARTVSRRYVAVVMGELISGGTFSGAIGRHPVHRIKMAVVEQGKPAVTHYRVEQRLSGCTVVDVSLETGRTHQIRVHFAHGGYPLVGDAVYGGRKRIPKGLTDEQREVINQFDRQALHARRLSFEHPASGDWVEFEAPLPEDLVCLISALS